MTTLETQRLILRGWRESDVDDLHDIMKNSSVIMGGWEPHANINVTLDVLNEYIENDDGWAVALKDSKKVIGCVRVCPDHNRGKLYQNVISNTKELSGATETALGNVNPQNTSAILAIQEASKIPLKIVRAALYQCIEDLANIWADMTFAYFASERLVPTLNDNGEYGSREIRFGERESKMRAFVEVVDESSYNSALSISILDKLLDGGYITPEEYISRIPSEYINNARALIGGALNERK